MRCNCGFVDVLYCFPNAHRVVCVYDNGALFCIIRLTIIDKCTLYIVLYMDAQYAMVFV